VTNGPVPGLRIPAWPLDKRTQWIAGGVAAGLLLLIVAVTVLRRKKARRVDATAPAELPAGSAAHAAISAGGTADDQIESQLAERAALEQKMEAQALSSLKLAPVITKTAEVLAKHLREKIAKEPDISAQVLRTWIREEES
jgi:flagellar biosynthesis/type III secretory pathway M-ring protein FliF/YscJ